MLSIREAVEEHPVSRMFYVFVTVYPDTEETYMTHVYAGSAIEAEYRFLDLAYYGKYEHTIHACHAVEVSQDNRAIISSYVLGGVIPITSQALSKRIIACNGSIKITEFLRDDKERKRKEMQA